MDVMLGVFVGGADARIALLDATAPHAVVDESSVDLTGEPTASLVSTVLSTSRHLTQTGHRLVGTRVCSSDDSCTAQFVSALETAQMNRVTAVSRSTAITAAMRALASDATIATLSSDGDTAALSIIEGDTETTSLIAVETIADGNRAGAYRALLERFSEEPGGAASVFVLDPPPNAALTAELTAAAPVPLRFADDPDVILARGAAIAPVVGLLGNNEIALSVVMMAGVAIALAASLASGSSGRGRGDGVVPA